MSPGNGPTAAATGCRFAKGGLFAFRREQAGSPESGNTSEVGETFDSHK